MVEIYKIFSRIRDPDIKLAVCSTQKTTFAETVAFALGQETARTIARPPVSEVRKMQVMEEEKSLLNKLRDVKASGRNWIKD